LKKSQKKEKRTVENERETEAENEKNHSKVNGEVKYSGFGEKKLIGTFIEFFFSKISHKSKLSFNFCYKYHKIVSFGNFAFKS
jgi:hypothetical protein